jgi:hypothetical protein
MNTQRSVVCTASHPHYQDDWSSWRCPVCGCELRLDAQARDAADGCPKLHSDDILSCDGCGFTGYGNFISRLLVTREYTSACQKCCGRGYAQRRRRYDTDGHRKTQQQRGRCSGECGRDQVARLGQRTST